MIALLPRPTLDLLPGIQPNRCIEREAPAVRALEPMKYDVPDTFEPTLLSYLALDKGGRVLGLALEAHHPCIGILKRYEHASRRLDRRERLDPLRTPVGTKPAPAFRRNQQTIGPHD
jgi:hypothetical protein